MTDSTVNAIRRIALEPRCQNCYFLGCPCAGPGVCDCKCHSTEPIRSLDLKGGMMELTKLGNEELLNRFEASSRQLQHVIHDSQQKGEAEILRHHLRAELLRRLSGSWAAVSASPQCAEPSCRCICHADERPCKACTAQEGEHHDFDCPEAQE